MNDGPQNAMKTAIAIAAHPDDIEFMMSGTLMLLKDHYSYVEEANTPSNFPLQWGHAEPIS